MRLIVSLLCILALTACSTGDRDKLTRSAAKRAVNPVIAQKFPSVPLEPTTDCIIDNANSQELLSLAADAVTGPTASTAEIVSNIVARPATLKCLVATGLPTLLK